MTTMKFAIVQRASNGKVSNDPGRYGVLVPVNMDGFYSDREVADDVARFMADQRPDLETLVVEVLAKL